MSTARTAKQERPELTPPPVPTIKWVDPATLSTEELFEGCFKIEPAIYERVLTAMREHGFYPTSPITVGIGPWKEAGEAGCVLDGHTRLAAARSLGVASVPIVELACASTYEAVLYAISCSRDRHNRDDAAIMRAVAIVDTLQPRGGDRRSAATKSKGSTGPIDRSADKTARAIGTSASKVKKARNIQKHPDLAEQVKRGAVGIHRAATIAKRRAQPPAAPKRRAPVSPPSPTARSLPAEELTAHFLVRIKTSVGAELAAIITVLRGLLDTAVERSDALSERSAAR